MSGIKNGWYLIYTKPHRERKVGADLQEKKIEYYLPMIKSLRIWHDRKKIIDAPLFPSYVFVNLSSPRHYFDVTNNDGFTCFVKIGKEMAMVRANVINDIKLLVAHGKDVEVSSEEFPAGSSFVIQDGPFTGMECQVVKHNQKDKVLVRLGLLNSNILASIPVQYIKN
jgi:transcriptional antiterminator RfaH